jgi:hypothetical protein
MNYGNRISVYIDPPDKEVICKARKLTNVPVVVMVSSYKKDKKGKLVPTDSVQFAQVLDTVFNEENIAIYIGCL